MNKSFKGSVVAADDLVHLHQALGPDSELIRDNMTLTVETRLSKALPSDRMHTGTCM